MTKTSSLCFLPLFAALLALGCTPPSGPAPASPNTSTQSAEDHSDHDHADHDHEESAAEEKKEVENLPVEKPAADDAAASKPATEKSPEAAMTKQAAPLTEAHVATDAKSGASADPQDWTYVRGPEYNGYSRATGLPDDFDPAGGEGSNVRWKA
ncbi:MAG: serine/threonine protein kinase, partial [Blastopirellula sp. JB062]